MNFKLSVTLSVEIDNKGTYVQSLSDDLENYFKNKHYGNGIKSYTIDLLCVSPAYDSFYKKDIKPKYFKGIKEMKFHGIPSTIENGFEYRIKIDYENFKIADETEAKKILAKEILSSLAVFETMRSKIKDFDLYSFRADLKECFESHKLI